MILCQHLFFTLNGEWFGLISRLHRLENNPKKNHNFAQKNSLQIVFSDLDLDYNFKKLQLHVANNKQGLLHVWPCGIRINTEQFLFDTNYWVSMSKGKS